jgi:hypothetical protein
MAAQKDQKSPRVYWPLVVFRVVGGVAILIGGLGVAWTFWNAYPGLRAFFS